jgi:hypothetical protein
MGRGKIELDERFKTTSIFFNALQISFPYPKYLSVREVRDATGYSLEGTRRYADAIAMGMYPYMGLDLYGFEFKVSKSDLNRELNMPEKAESIMRYCDFWFLVTPPGLTVPEKVPANWGLIEVKDGRFKYKKKAPRLEPCSLTKHFIASICRSVYNRVDKISKRYISPDEMQKRINESYRLGLRAGRNQTEGENK